MTFYRHRLSRRAALPSAATSALHTRLADLVSAARAAVHAAATQDPVPLPETARLVAEVRLFAALVNDWRDRGVNLLGHLRSTRHPARELARGALLYALDPPSFRRHLAQEAAAETSGVDFGDKDRAYRWLSGRCIELAEMSARADRGSVGQ